MEEKMNKVFDYVKNFVKTQSFPAVDESDRRRIKVR